jgi:hypothetical protein
MTFTEAAVLILKAEGKPLTWRKLAELAVRHELLSHVGTDPAETMHVRLADIVRRQGDQAPFVEGKGGNYSLREWGGSSPGPSAEAEKELLAYKDRHPAAPPAPPPPPARTERRSRSRGESGAAGRGRTRAGRGRTGEPKGHAAATEATAVATTESGEQGAARDAGRGAPVRRDEGTAVSDGASASGAAPDVAAAAVPGEPARTGEGRKRRRRGRRRRGGATQPVEVSAEAPPPAAPPVSVPSPSPAAPSAPPPAQAQPQPPQQADRSPRPPAPAGSSVACAPCDLGRAAEAVLRLLRSQGGRRPLRLPEILAQLASRGFPEGKLPPPALAAVLAGADGSSRVGAPFVGLSGGRWAAAEWVWGDESAALERRIGEAVGPYLAALRRAILRRLAEMPLPTFQQIIAALLAAEGFRDIRPLEDAAANGGEQLLLRARMPYGPAEISMIVLVVRGAPGRFISEDQVAILRGRLPRTGACGGAIVTLGRVSDAARRDLVPPNAIPLLAVEHDALAERLLAHRIGVRARCLEVPALDPDVFGDF